MAYIETTGQALLDPLVILWDSFVKALPGLVAALLVIIAGYAVASLLGFVVRKVIEKSKLEQHLKKAKMAESLSWISIGGLAGGLAKWYVFIIFLTASTDLLQLGVLSDLLRRFALWLPSLLVSVIILVVGIILADFLGDMTMKAKLRFSKAASTMVRITVLLVFGLTALDQTGLDVSFISSALLILLAGFVFAFALAFGIGMGLVMKDDSKEIVKWMKRNL